MARGIIRHLLSLPCRRRDHVWVPRHHDGYFVCADCGEPGFRVPKVEA